MHGGNNHGAGARLVWRPGLEAAWQGRKRYIEQRHALGLKSAGGRPSKRWLKRWAGERERVLAMADDLIEVLEDQRPPADKPLEQWTIAELLTDGARLGLIADRTVAGWELVEECDATRIKHNRLITDAGSRLYKTLARVQEASMRKADSEDWRGLLERLEKVKAAE